MLKAIETVYNGYRFRSRLEARWAVFFDTLGISYEYEKEGYDLDGTWYLPDFWLPIENIWVEVKPDTPSADTKRVCSLLSEKGLHPLLLVIGAPIDKMMFFTPDGAWTDAVYFHQRALVYERMMLWQGNPVTTPALAAEAAKQARFEHGEHGAPQPSATPPVTVEPRRWIPEPPAFAESKTLDAPPPQHGDISGIAAVWPQVKADVRVVSRSLEAFLNEVRPWSIEGTTVALRANYPFHADSINNPKNRSLVADAISHVLGNTYDVYAFHAREV